MSIIFCIISRLKRDEQTDTYVHFEQTGTLREIVTTIDSPYVFFYTKYPTPRLGEHAQKRFLQGCPKPAVHLLALLFCKMMYIDFAHLFCRLFQCLRNCIFNPGGTECCSADRIYICALCINDCRDNILRHGKISAILLFC